MLGVLTSEDIRAGWESTYAYVYLLLRGVAHYIDRKLTRVRGEGEAPIPEPRGRASVAKRSESRSM